MTRLRFAVCLVLLISSCTGQTVRGLFERDNPQIAEYVVEAFADTKGVLWFGTMNAGVARHDPNGDVELTYLTEKDGLCGDTIVSIAEDKRGMLWFAGHTGACSYDGETFTRVFDVESNVRADRWGSVWVSTNDAVYRHDGSSFIEFEVPLVELADQPYSIVNGRVTFALEDRQHNLWFATDGYGAFRFDGETFTQFTKKDGLCSNTVWSILEDRQGRVWFTCVQAFQPTMTGDGGVSRYDGERFTSFPDVAGLSANDIYTIFQDQAGNIWIGATGLGVYRYDGSTFTLFDDTDRPDVTSTFGLQALTQDKGGTLWAGFSGGLFRFDGASFVHVGRDGPWK